MSFPTVVGRTQGEAKAASVNVSVPIGGNGHLLVAVVGVWDRNATVGADSIFSWTALGGDDYAWVGTRVTDGTEGPEISFTVTGGSPNEGGLSVLLWRITNWIDVQVGGIRVIYSGFPNSEELSPAWGSAETLWLTVAASDQRFWNNSLTPPANYDHGRMAPIAYREEDGIVVGAERLLEAASEDPGALEIDDGSEWGCATIGIQGKLVLGYSGYGAINI